MVVVFWISHLVVVSQNRPFLCSENGKCLFGAIKRKTSSCNIVCHAMMHMYAQYGHIMTNYVLILAITLVIWPESQETSNEIGHFVKVFWDIINIPSLRFFLLTMSHNITPRQGFALFRSFFIFYPCFKLSSNFVEQRAWRFLARGQASLNFHWFFDKIAYFEPKNDFCKKSWA